MTIKDLSPEMRNVIKRNDICVLSTVNKTGKAESALVSFCETEDLSLILRTSLDSRKARNILVNKGVSLVIGTDSAHLDTLQIEGPAEIIEPEESNELEKVFLEKIPMAAKAKPDPRRRYIIVKPTWIRYTFLGQFPWKIEEANL